MKKPRIISFLILILAFLAGNFVFPQYFNQASDFIKEKTGFWLPKFAEVPFKLGLDLQGGIHLVYEADLSGVDQADKASSMEGLRDVIERRVNFFGVDEPVIQTEQNGERHRLIVELAGVIDPAQAIEEIGKTPLLQFREQKENFEEILENNQKVFETGEGELQDPFLDTELTGQYLGKAAIDLDSSSYNPSVSLQFTDEGADIFEQITERNVGKILAIYIDGLPISSPVVEEKIGGGRALISGSFTIEEAKELARNLNAGALPVPIHLISQQTVGPTLGKISLEKSLFAGLAGLIAVVVFLIFFYKLPGLLASLALSVYVALILSLFKIIPVTLTLAGIGGFILSIGIAVDANVLIFSRMREELKSGKGFSSSIQEGFKRAWPAIRDGNLTTLLVAFILFFFGTSFVKGFSLTLIIGILVSMFSAIFATQNFLECFEGTRLEKIRWLWK